MAKILELIEKLRQEEENSWQELQKTLERPDLRDLNDRWQNLAVEY